MNNIRSPVRESCQRRLGWRKSPPHINAQPQQSFDFEGFSAKLILCQGCKFLLLLIRLFCFCSCYFVFALGERHAGGADKWRYIENGRDVGQSWT